MEWDRKTMYLLAVLARSTPRHLALPLAQAAASENPRSVNGVGLRNAYVKQHRPTNAIFARLNPLDNDRDPLPHADAHRA